MSAFMCGQGVGNNPASPLNISLVGTCVTDAHADGELCLMNWFMNRKGIYQ